MPLPLIKATQVNNLTDARYFAAREVAWIGFCLDTEQPSAIPLTYACEIAAWLHGPQLIAEFGPRPDTALLRAAINALQLRTIQLHFEAPSEIAVALKTEGVSTIWHYPLEQCSSIQDLEHTLSTLASTAHAIILDAAELPPHLPQQLLQGQYLMPLQQWQQVLLRFNIILQLPATDAPTTHQLLHALQPYGWQLAGGIEEQTGVRIFDDLDNWFDCWDTLLTTEI